jgi:hypothetical protein
MPFGPRLWFGMDMPAPARTVRVATFAAAMLSLAISGCGNDPSARVSPPASCEPDPVPAEVTPPRFLPRGGPVSAPSADGRFLGATGVGDPHWYYLIAIETNTATPLDLGPSGEAPGEDSAPATPEVALAAWGRYAAFVESGGTLVPGIDGSNLIFVRDLEAKTTEYVAPGFNPSLSAQGRYVVFAADEALTAQDRNSQRDVYRYDRRTRELLLMSEASADAGLDPSVSADGCVVAWRYSGLLVRDLRKPETSGPLELHAGNGVGPPTLSGDGRYVAFVSSASDLVPGDTNNAPDAFVYDRQTRAIERVSISSNQQASGVSGLVVWISSDARYVLFSSENLDPYDPRLGMHIRDRQAKRTWRIPKFPEPGDVPEEG